MSVGGAQENTLLSCLGLDKKAEYEITLLSGEDNGKEGDLIGLAKENCKVIMLPELGRSINPFSDLLAFWKLYKLTKAGRYHIVHTHMSKAGVLGRITAKLAGTPIVVHTLHSLVFHDYQPWVINRALRLIKKFCALFTDYFISVSEIIARNAIKAGIDRPEKFRAIYSGMELDWFLNYKGDGKDVRKEFGIPDDALVVGKIARLFRLKGHEQLFDAAPEIVKRHPNVRFFLIGDGELTDHFKQRAATQGISENFVFAGMIDRQRIPEMISAMDILAHTSLREGLARVLPQALAMGKPCVSFELDGAPEVVIDEKTGYLVRAGDSSGLADAISKLLEDPEKRRIFGENGRLHVNPMFQAQKMVDDIADVYQMLLELYPDRIAKFDRKFAKSV